MADYLTPGRGVVKTSVPWSTINTPVYCWCIALYGYARCLSQVLHTWVPPAFLEGGGQDRARGRHLTAANALPAFSWFDQFGGEGAVRFRLIQPVRGGGEGAVHFWLIQPVGGRGGAVRFQPIQPVGGGGGGGGGCTCMLTFITGRGRHSVQKGGGGGAHVC